MKMIQFIRKRQNAVFAASFVLCVIFLLWKVQYGYFFNDEPFILTLGHRLLKGDKLFVHEWNLTQLVSFFIVPFMQLFIKVTGCLDGVILYFRYLYVLFHSCVSLILYKRLKNFGPVSIIAVLYYFMFTPLDTASVTYNVISLSSFVLFGTYFLTRRTIVGDFITGIVIAAGILVSPYSIVIYFVYALGVFFINGTKLKSKENLRIAVFDIKRFIGITAGSILMAVLFCGYLVNVGLNDVFISIKFLLSHRNTGTGLKFYNLFQQVVKYDFIQLLFGVPVLVLSIIDKNRYQKKYFYFSIQTFLWLSAMAYLVVFQFMALNVIMLPISILGLQAYILSSEKDLNMFLGLFVTGALFAFISNVSSDTGIFVFAMASVVSGIASVLFISRFLCEIEVGTVRNKRYSVLLCLVIFLVQIVAQCGTRLIRTYWDLPITWLDYRITCGAGYGIKTNREDMSRYEEIYQDLQIIKRYAEAEDEVLIASLFPSAYLDLDMNYGTYSSWSYTNNQNQYDSFTDQLSVYYELHPNKIPSVIYIAEEDMHQCSLLNDVIDIDNFKQIQGKRGVIFVSSQ